MAEENSQEEPSMDDILSSIRTILSEDDETADVKSQADVKAEAAPEVIAKKEEPVAVRSATAPMETTSDPEVTLAAAVSTSEPALNRLAESEVAANTEVGAVPPQQPVESVSLEANILELTQQMIAQSPSDIGAGDSILSNGPSANSTDALQELAKALLSKRDIAVGNRDMTLEGLVREIIRPLLREWLDQNLPYLIERLVKKEIDHMVNRAERLDL
jgi:cell pole-organizing protein PopZ